MNFKVIKNATLNKQELDLVKGGGDQHHGCIWNNKGGGGCIWNNIATGPKDRPTGGCIVNNV